MRKSIKRATGPVGANVPDTRPAAKPRYAALHEQHVGVAEGHAGGYMNVDQAAEFLACKRDRIYALVSAGRIPHHRDGTRLLFDRAELREYVRDGGARRP